MCWAKFRKPRRSFHYLPFRNKRSLLAEMRQIKAHKCPIRQETFHRKLSLAHEVTAPNLDKCAALGDAVPRGV